jgi:hypothetical protein
MEMPKQPPLMDWGFRFDPPLHVGQILYDNDPRYEGRKVEIVRVEDRRIICKCGPREVTIRRDRVHLDGERRRSGFSTAPPTV